MNLCDVIRRKDPVLDLPNSYSMAKRQIDGIRYSGFCVDFQAKPQNGMIFSMKKPFQWYPFKEMQSYKAWGVQLLKNQLENAQLQVKFLKDGEYKTVKDIPLKVGEFVYPFKNLPVDESADELVITCNFQNSKKYTHFWSSLLKRKSKVFVAVHEVMNRESLREYCKGVGLELGPGHNPFLKPNGNVDVKYVEQHHPEKWAELYGSSKFVVDPETWSHYIIGEAHSLPVEDNTQNYIFSSHVFEHLYNPLGHIEHWLKKLKSGGYIVAVVPAIEGCKDYPSTASTLDSILAEYKLGGFEPQLEQYEHYSRIRKMRETGQQLMDRKRSIHVHYYTQHNIVQLLDWAKENMDVLEYKLIYKMNNKDFYFIITKK